MNQMVRPDMQQHINTTRRRSALQPDGCQGSSADSEATLSDTFAGVSGRRGCTVLVLAVRELCRITISAPQIIQPPFP